MSDLMFNEAPNKRGAKYKTGDWQEYAIHDEKNVKGFFGPARYLSNFELCKVPFEGLIYPSSENCYQAAKLIPELREPFLEMSPYKSKNAWKVVDKECLITDWDTIKFRVMQEVVFSKFLHNTVLRDKLVSTGNKYLEETNHWYDSYYGFCIHTNQGQNNLGKILMATRAYFYQIK